VSPAPLTITANSAIKTYGTAYTAVGTGQTAFTPTGLQNDESVGSVTITASGGTLAADAVGAYTLMPSAATAGTLNANNYAITYAGGTLTVNSAQLTVTPNAASRIYDGTTLPNSTYSRDPANYTISGFSEQ